MVLSERFYGIVSLPVVLI